MSCPCGSGKNYNECCELIITGKRKAETAEELMRSRYSAFVKAEIEYLHDTLAPESRRDFDKQETRKWAEQAKWKGLKIMEVKGGGADDNKGSVEFVATYEIEGEALDHHEVSKFRKSDDGKWFFIEGDSHTHREGEGHLHRPQTVQRETPKIGRNDPCPCGSGKKYKKCCGSDS